MTEDYPIESSSNEGIDAIITRCLQGEQSGFSELYALFAPGIYRLCYSLLLSAEDAEDISQEAFVYAFKNLHRYDSSRAAFKTWLYTIAVSRCRNMYRRKRLPSIGISQLLQLNVPAPSSETPEAVLARQTARDTVESALRGLSPRLREAIVLRYGHGLTYREIADVMDCPQKTAESRVRLAHTRLRDALRTVGPGLLEELLRASG